MMVGSISRLFWVIPAAMLIIAPAPLPYVYYRVLRLVVFVCAGAISLQVLIVAAGMSGQSRWPYLRSFSIPSCRCI